MYLFISVSDYVLIYLCWCLCIHSGRHDVAADTPQKGSQQPEVTWVKPDPCLYWRKEFHNEQCESEVGFIKAKIYGLWRWLNGS